MESSKFARRCPGANARHQQGAVSCLPSSEPRRLGNRDETRISAVADSHSHIRGDIGSGDQTGDMIEVI
jgi:hypothetical protein